ncbi:TniQ family protein [Paenibacillus allorhizosphaerae]|uniref:TniQ domain-containing protein n=1 Tax=Paenibacillus allorhizosphaerae TaxID=2849866 RepID=A0ABM8VE76_9BACL|nr:TnsD family Tn7-like transposition protein [Paenibacillus allorhizosphaerae]CAG7630060.1 hypothetical protein PAECIP111802_01615 [Paenibacillus allorhizosphaerae]
MLQHFVTPPPLPDEDIRSIIFRYHKESGSQNFIKTARKILGKDTGLNALFTTNIGKFLNAIPGKNSYDFTNFIFDHTYLPIFRIFLSRVKQKSVLEMLYVCNESNSQIQIGQTSNISTEINYCPLCSIEDYYTNGVCYIHRIHQIKDLNMCYKHKIDLLSKCTKCNKSFANKKGTELLTTPQCNNCGTKFEKYAFHVKGDELKSNVLQDIEFLLAYKDEINCEIMKGLNFHYALANDLVLKKGAFKEKEYIEYLNSQFEEEKLASVNISTSSSVRAFSLNSLGLKQWSVILQILNMRLFAGSAEAFLTRPLPIIASNIPLVDETPIECHNPSCLSLINGFKRTYDPKAKSYDQIYTCPVCGIIFSSKRSKRFNSVVIIQKPLIQRNGEKRVFYPKRTREWFVRLVQLYDQSGISKNNAIELGCSLETFKKYIKMYHQNNEDLICFTSLRINTDYIKCRCEEIEKQVIEVKKSNPNITRNQLLDVIGKAQYDFLIKYDYEWTEANFPKRVSGYRLPLAEFQ